jgi:hypothetical protein
LEEEYHRRRQDKQQEWRLKQQLHSHKKFRLPLQDGLKNGMREIWKVTWPRTPIPTKRSIVREARWFGAKRTLLPIIESEGHRHMGALTVHVRKINGLWRILSDHSTSWFIHRQHLQHQASRCAGAEKPPHRIVDAFFPDDSIDHEKRNKASY